MTNVNPPPPPAAGNATPAPIGSPDWVPAYSRQDIASALVGSPPPGFDLYAALQQLLHQLDITCRDADRLADNLTEGLAHVNDQRKMMAALKDHHHAKGQR